MNSKQVEATVNNPTAGDSLGSAKSLLESYSKGSNVQFMKEMYENSKKLDPNAECPSCAGMPEKTCEVCGQGKIMKVVDYLQIESEQIFDNLGIPPYIAKDAYNSATLLSDKKHLADNTAFQMYCSKTDRLLESFTRGNPLMCSIFVGAPSGFGKEHLVYSIMLAGMDNGLTVFPYIDLSEAQQLINSYEKGKDDDPIRTQIKFTDIDLYNSDICILKVPHSENQLSYQTALTVIDRRARRGKSTIIVSRYPFKYFTLRDSTKEFQGIISNTSIRPKNIQLIEFIK